MDFPPNDYRPNKRKYEFENLFDFRNTIIPVWRGRVMEKIEKAAPYYFFLTRVRDSLNTYFEDLSITFPELLDISLGDLEHSVHINFLVDVGWLFAQYRANDLSDSPMTIITGLNEEVCRYREPKRTIKTIAITPTNRFGKMHTKMSMFFYTDKSVRFVIYTANLTEADWTNRTQGLWISPRCPFMGDDVPINYGESDTLFKVDMIKYLASYDIPELREWIVRIQKCDLSSIRVCLVASIPGQFNDDSYGYKKLNKLLRENVTLPNTDDWNYVAQCSSIGSLGPSPLFWFRTFSRCLQGNGEGPYSTIKVIFPSLNNVLESHGGIEGANCIPYTSKVHNLQRWVRDHLYKWRSDFRHRTKALPHIKSYARVTKDGKKIAWFLLTSANLSKAAWGSERENDSCAILSHELGVLFLPKYFNGGDIFKAKKGGFQNHDRDSFPLPYDTPIVPYDHDDLVFLADQNWIN